jgi:hypothetical protein
LRCKEQPISERNVVVRQKQTLMMMMMMMTTMTMTMTMTTNKSCNSETEFRNYAISGCRSNELLSFAWTSVAVHE